MKYRYTFYLPENGQTQAIITDPDDDDSLTFELKDRFLFVPTEQYDLYISLAQLKCVTREKIDQNQIVIPQSQPQEEAKAEG